MKSLNLIPLLLITGFILSNSILTNGQNTSGWRGNDRDDKVTGFKTPAKWPEQLNKIWQITVGAADASPVLMNSKLYLHVKVDSSEVLLCVDANKGTELWRTILNPAPEVTGPAMGHPGPRSTPFLTNGKIYTLGINGILTCTDSKTGKIIWQDKSYTAEVPEFFTACSPLIFDDKCVVQLGGKNNGVIVAFDASTGKEIWKMEGEPCTYSSPVLMKSLDNMLLFQSETNLLGVSKDGKLLWRIPTPNQQRFYSASTPLFDGRNIIVTGQGTGTKAYSLNQVDGKWEPTEIWNNASLGVSFCTPLIKDGFLYANEAKSGSLFCINSKTGEKAWANNNMLNRFASVVDLDKVLVSLPAKGKMFVFEPNGTSYVELAQYKVADSDVYAHPLFMGNKIIIKDQDKLTCWAVE